MQVKFEPTSNKSDYSKKITTPHADYFCTFKFPIDVFKKQAKKLRSSSKYNV